MRSARAFVALAVIAFGLAMQASAETTPNDAPAAAEDARITEVRNAWGAMRAMAEAMDPQLVNFYSDAARIHVTIIAADGSTQIIEMTGKALKEKLAVALDPATGDAVGLTDTYSGEMFAVAANGRVNMTATRHVVTLDAWFLTDFALTGYDAPHQMTWRKRGDDWRIVEERIEIRR